MRVRPARPALTGLAALALALTGCGGAEEEASSAVVSAELPDDLCRFVPDEVVERWDLVVTVQQAAGDDDAMIATCEMAGRVDGRRVTLSVRVSSYGGADLATAGAAARAELSDACVGLEDAGAGTFEGSDTGCTRTAPARPASARGHTVDVHPSGAVRGVVRVEMTHRGSAWKRVAPDTLSVSAAIRDRATLTA